MEPFILWTFANDGKRWLSSIGDGQEMLDNIRGDLPYYISGSEEELRLSSILVHKFYYASCIITTMHNVNIEGSGICDYTALVLEEYYFLASLVHAGECLMAVTR
ncbi:hypothetical protein WN943_015034 [Citrus x changshan-huyou]